MSLNHYAINQIVGGKMVAGVRTRFGQFGLPSIVNSVLKNRPRPRAHVAIDLGSDRIVEKAFRATFDGHSAESLLLDKSLSSKFHAEARRLGFHASTADLNRRLINIRKNPARYSKQGIELPKSTKVTPHPSIVPQYAHVVEFALSRLRYRYGVSIDDILIDPDLTDEYEKMVAIAAPQLSSLDMRLAALYVRKTRHVAKSSEELFKSLNVERIDNAFADLGVLTQLDTTALKDEAGIIEILENGRYLYISRNDHLRSSVEQIASNSSLVFMANDFWQPNPAKLSIRLLAGERFLNTPVSQWQLKLISEHKPVFNYPVAA